MNILFAGTPVFAAQHLQGLVDSGVPIQGVITQPDKPGKRGKKAVAGPVKQLAEKLHLPIYQPARLNLSTLDSLAIDLLIVVAYGQILKPELLELPTYGCINVHGSILPRWRGAAPVQRAIEAGDTTSGICIMQMDAGLDTGDILCQKTISILKADTSQSLMDKLAILGVDALIEVIDQIRSDSLNPVKQPEEGTYARKISKAEARCDWQLNAALIRQKIQAFNPDPICYTFLGDLRVKLYQATSIDATSGSPGEVLEVSKAGILVAAGRGAVLLERLQLPLGKGSVLNGSDILNARQDIIYPGVKFT